jgi:hypothetical protein
VEEGLIMSLPLDQDPRWLHPRDGRQRPCVELEPTGHPLAIEQQRGISLDRLLEIYALNGHDLRPALWA